MPLFDCVCVKCGHQQEVLLRGNESPLHCGVSMRKLPSFPAMVKMKGEGGYPSRRKFVGGTAPYTTRSTKAWGAHDPSADINYMGTKK